MSLPKDILNKTLFSVRVKMKNVYYYSYATRYIHVKSLQHDKPH